MNRASKENAFEVSDPTDWIETPLPKLSGVDSALRCQVCKDFYTTPMTTSCSHTFCSLCIRRSLNNDGKCPACRTPDQELKLRFNGALEGVVEAFKRARLQVLDFATTKAPVAEPALPTRKRKDVVLEEEGGSRKKTRTSGRRTRSSQQEAVANEDSAGEDDDEYVPEDGLVECPICQKRVKEASINSHIDAGCADMPAPRVTKSLGRGKQTAPPVPDKPINRPERLAQQNYQFLKDPALRKKLTDMGLSAGGSRQLLERRYTEWVTIWNANCDATRPKSRTELKWELDVWERTQGKSTVSAQGAQIKDKDFDGKGWSTMHDSNFRDLIAKARAKVPPKSSTPIIAETASSSAPNPMMPATEPGKLRVQADTPMSGRDDAMGGQDFVGDSPTKSRFFEESKRDIPPPSSQNVREVPILRKDASITSEMSTSQPLQP